MVECVALKTVSHVLPTESEIETCCLDPIPPHIDCVSDYQTENLKSDSMKGSCLDSPTKNVLKIVLPLVSESVPLNGQSKLIKHNKLLKEELCIVSSNNHVQYIPKHDVDMPVGINKNVNNRNHSLPEDSELNRFSSTFENIKTLLKEGLVDGLDEMPPDFQPPNPPLLYRVSSLPNLLSHDSTKNHHSCSYLTMCATKHELFMNKFCKNIVAKHDMSVQVSTELFKNQNEKILVDTSCQTEDIFINGQVNNEVLTKETNHSNSHPSSNGFKNDSEMNTDIQNEMISNITEDNVSNGYININVINTECENKTNEEEDCASYCYSDVNILKKEQEINANEEDCTSIGYININVFNKEKVKSSQEEECCNVSYTKITTFDKECEIKPITEKCVNVDYKNMNMVDNGNSVSVNKEPNSKIGYTNINMIFDKELEVKTNGEDCVDIGYTDFSLYDKGLQIDPNDDCENYANANILEEFVNEQLSLNNGDGDFDSFLFGPLPPSPIEEIGKVLNNFMLLFCK